MAKAGVVKFCKYVDYIKFELSVDKVPLKEEWSGSHDDPFLPRDAMLVRY